MCYAAFRTRSACAPILLWIKCQVASAPFPCRRPIPPGVLSRWKISKSERGLTTPRVPWTAGRSSQSEHCRAHRDPPRVGCMACWGTACGPAVGQQAQHLRSARSAKARQKGFLLPTDAAHQHLLALLRPPSSRFPITARNGHLLYLSTRSQHHACNSHQQVSFPRCTALTCPRQPGCYGCGLEAVGHFLLPRRQPYLCRMPFWGVCPRRAEPEND